MPATLSQSIRPQVRTIDGLAIRYAESEPRGDHALLLSPWPESKPKSKLDLLDAGHFIWEDAADQCAALVLSWWAGGYAKVPSGRTSS